jgi:hypothetical protein
MGCQKAQCDLWIATIDFDTLLISNQGGILYEFFRKTFNA